MSTNVLFYYFCAYNNCIRSIFRIIAWTSRCNSICIDDNIFPINRGVYRGDILSPLLFNSGAEQALCEWKTLLRTEGFSISDDEGIPRVLRYWRDLKTASRGKQV